MDRVGTETEPVLGPVGRLDLEDARELGAKELPVVGDELPVGSDDGRDAVPEDSDAEPSDAVAEELTVPKELRDEELSVTGMVGTKLPVDREPDGEVVPGVDTIGDVD